MDFVQEGANLAGAQGTLYQKTKTLRIGPTIFWVRSNYFLLFYFYYIFRLGGHGPRVPLGYVPANESEELRIVFMLFSLTFDDKGTVLGN